VSAVDRPQIAALKPGTLVLGLDYGTLRWGISDERLGKAVPRPHADFEAFHA
jgi:hypothetical protein